ncbi:KAP family P-loop NTPase fold protein [Acinetobacter sp. SWAC57]|uniref:KAP family P-loop NTPase fold protein n=1 Tax=Acinetobacter sp. SWAC57 TaxID=2293834 RepID=UPI000E5BC24A|nr:P-loop NTPase fold protein [Acinetobacter sp. SWAC57]RGD93818.1 P-loop ATPase [Acinetobacter sp. SWAC57]
MTDTNQLNWQRTNLDNIETAWEDDLWDRKRLGIQLTNYVDRLQCGAVLALDARWGEGKTWFVRHWQKHLEDENHNVIYLDAFANDYLDDPFLVISSEIASKLNQTADKRLVHKFKKAAAVLQQGLLTQAPTIIASMISFALTGGIIPFLKLDNDSIKDKYEDIVDQVTDNIGEKVTEAIQKKIDDYEEEKQSLNAFKETLAKLAESLDKPLVFIIDELDRCRPDFAIRLIERIKHFFDIPKIVFVLVMDKTQFSKVICHNYGYDESLGEEYLTKFVDFTIELKHAKDSENFELIIKDQLFKIGELNTLEELSEIYYWALYLQLHVKMNSRELIKRINQYALLRTESNEKNLILITFIFGSITANNFKPFIKEIFQELIKDLRGDVYHFGRKHGISTWGGNYDEITSSEWYKIIMQRELQISNSLLNIVITAYHDSDKSQDKTTKEHYLRQGLENFSISDFTHSNNFALDWENYIKRGI